jgi:hypothetical protein
MKGAIPLLLLYACMALTGTILFYFRLLNMCIIYGHEEMKNMAYTPNSRNSVQIMANKMKSLVSGYTYNSIDVTWL